MDNTLSSQIKDLENRIKEAEQLISDPELGSLAQEEIKNLNLQKEQLEQAVASIEGDFGETPTNTGGANLDGKNAILEIKGAAGGDEAKNWGRELLRMYMRYAELKGLRTESLDEYAIKVSGRNAFGIFKYGLASTGCSGYLTRKNADGYILLLLLSLFCRNLRT
jgi:protein subunit release factor A